jgi:hypothetical protein
MGQRSELEILLIKVLLLIMWWFPLLIVLVESPRAAWGTIVA